MSPNRLFAGLYPWKTELDTIEKITVDTRALEPIQQQKLKGLQTIFVKSALDVPSKLSGADFATRLHLLRVGTGYDAATVAGKCLIARATLQGYESVQYDPSVPAVLRLCEVMSVTPEYLLAPALVKLTYMNEEIVDLYPQQIKSLQEITTYFIRTMG